MMLAERDVLGERDQLALDVDRRRTDAGHPQLADVTHRVVQDLADQHRLADRAHRPGDDGVDAGVLARVDAGGVLRPDHHVRRGQAARLDLGGQLGRGRGLVLGDLGVVQLLRQVPGVRHVTLDRGHRDRRRSAHRVNGQQSTREHQPGRNRRGQPRAGQVPRPPAARAEQRQQRPGQHGAGQRDQEAQQRHAADRDPADVRSHGLAHAQPAPGERVRPAVPQRLGRHPPARHRGRPERQLQQQPLGDAKQGEDQRLGPGQPGPRVPGHIDQPGQQRHEQRQAEHQAAAERRPQAPPGQRDHQAARAPARPAATGPAAGTRRRPPARPRATAAGPSACGTRRTRPAPPVPRPGSGHSLGDHARTPMEPHPEPGKPRCPAPQARSAGL